MHRASIASVIVLYLLVLATGPASAATAIADGEIKGIWSIANGPAKQHRWLIVHDHFESGGTNVYHIEVIARAAGAPAWQIGRLAPHMAITEPALKRSIVKPLNRGGVYPEAFHDARAAWQAANGGAGGAVCATSVRECLNQ